MFGRLARNTTAVGGLVEIVFHSASFDDIHVNFKFPENFEDIAQFTGGLLLRVARVQTYTIKRYAYLRNRHKTVCISSKSP